ncbi:hypothetical protein O4H52_11255 [Sphingomonadaceae bacterium G21617-S1]|uniref:hypothetical protein n=1 Tax=Rhizorhabdus sp. TaxID=1968843 RepID=UPI0012059493|nr:hypothetical protein [Rhizorhabdus sp.]MBD3759817.1 hypothetical protein [Rhizorhabdus sp.]MCZ4342188.1 hypothetical protein [Sphingomonadaceae bacterium G21617-S1]TAK11170.1 MAG: hypothetical protein EPO38_07115 [Rhizorhabdus sp.]
MRSRRIVTFGASRRKSGLDPRTAEKPAAEGSGRKMTHAIVNLLHRRQKWLRKGRIGLWNLA